MINCKKYNSHTARLSRCTELRIFSSCSSTTKHLGDKCPQQLDFQCSFCHTKKHISALCPNYRNLKISTYFCLNASSDCSGTYILPAITVEFSKGKSVARVRRLVNTGSQRSYISSSVIQRLNILDCTYDKKILVNTFANIKFKKLSEMWMSVSFVNGSTGYSLPILVDRQFSLNFEINGLFSRRYL